MLYLKNFMYFVFGVSIKFSTEINFVKRKNIQHSANQKFNYEFYVTLEFSFLCSAVMV